jgi:hypothetical protein
LAKTEGDEVALGVYKDLIEKCRNEAIQVNANRYLFYSDEIREDGWSQADFIKKLQSKGDLGNKMQDAFREVFNTGDSKTLIIGSDCFDLTAEIIERAFEKLAVNDIVIGPANDGGYYLLGMKGYHKEIFDGIDWSTEVVFEQTVQKARNKNLSIGKLEELIDIDNIYDLEKSGYNYKAD